MTHDEALSTLGLTADAGDGDVKLAYRELAQMLHPDKYGDNKRLRERAEHQMRAINEARDVLLKSSGRTKGRASGSTAVRDDGPRAIAHAADLRARAAETARIALACDLRTLEERFASMRTVAIGAVLVAFVTMRLRGTVGALVFSISSLAATWSCVDMVLFHGQIRALRQRSRELIKTRDAARRIADEARKL